MSKFNHFLILLIAFSCLASFYFIHNVDCGTVSSAKSFSEYIMSDYNLEGDNVNPNSEKEETRWDKVKEAISKLQEQIDLITNILVGLGLLTCIALVTITFIKFANLEAHPIKRRHAMVEFGVLFVCIGLLGCIKFIEVLILNSI